MEQEIKLWLRKAGDRDGGRERRLSHNKQDNTPRSAASTGRRDRGVRLAQSFTGDGDGRAELAMGQWVMGHGSNGSPKPDGSHGSWVTGC